MPDYANGRDRMLQLLREELIGPSPQGKEIDCTKPISFDVAQESYGPWRQQGSGEEILQRDPPSKRYGVGVLYPWGASIEDNQTNDNSTNIVAFSDIVENENDNNVMTSQAQKSIELIENRSGSAEGTTDIPDIEIPAVKGNRPSSMGISFLADIPDDAILTVNASGGRYHKHTIFLQGQERIWWLRSQVTIRATFEASQLCTQRESKLEDPNIQADNADDLDIAVELYSRPYKHMAGRRIITVCLVNRSKKQNFTDQYCLFQSFFKVHINTSETSNLIHPYPDSTAIDIDVDNILPLDDEEESLALLYRKARTFAVGHNCAANWGPADTKKQEQLFEKNYQKNGEQTATIETVAWVSAETLPTIEIPSTTPNVERKDGTKVEVEMKALAGLIPGDDGIHALKEVLQLYEDWIEQQSREISTLDLKYRQAAQKHVDECKKCVDRMKQGLYYLQTTPKAMRAFKLANHAMLLQQTHAGREPRKYQTDQKAVTVSFSPPYHELDLNKLEPNQGKWRAFQVAFLLMTVQSTADPQSMDRKQVELIWFPTGGGKTEAYLGLAAYAMFMRRLEKSANRGVQVLMRYTLRLLTAQQFQRASTLICAMEHLRRKNTEELGTNEFSIGVWVGNATTPNKRDEAIAMLNGLARNDRSVENKFLVNKCPWCRAQMGPIKPAKSGRSAGTIPVSGYSRKEKTVIFHCPDRQCEFYRNLPIYVIDEDIYEKRPTMLIGTVDKFALIAWKNEVRNIFGINPEGVREYAPPSLIIQDELHLISGPLGSMVGLYETLIEELCTDRRYERPISPKIISSTATIRRYKEQVQRLFGRDNVSLFPPPGLSVDDSFFARYATNAEGNLEHGRLHVGVYAPGLGSLQTAQVRSFTALLQSPLALSEAERDPWWSLLLFFNSLRELGTTLSLFQSDIPDYFRVLMNREGKKFDELRKFWNILELTGRLKNEEVPEAIAKLEIEYKKDGQRDRPVDVCLASNIIEVGVDIDRLSLMTVVGQPKTTSQYIQVTGRVGRRWWERPGLVITLYGLTRPRDRSHYEKFRSYHERLYAQVEPTSVTPFSPPVLDRALHAIMAAYVRQLGDKDNARSPYPYPSHLIEKLRQILIPRIEAIDPGELPNFIRVFDNRINQWKSWQRNVWEDNSGNEIPLLVPAGAYVTSEQKHLTWQTANSMRNVDAECNAVITSLYAEAEEGQNNG
ncbi:helicase-related protein [Tengunoibacter tsumagoiensis]|uniref:DNA helicase n=1 Tax=Tengunoibacter tsumagoiensis TaxID=2014871 RepID=A0A402A0C2_9CHLR|nr:helicase-related protein [Tengunoibacter tsumagoiensis]GCE12502.1 DNA helicase [Tengunoibacter tsumagoiensis]